MNGDARTPSPTKPGKTSPGSTADERSSSRPSTTESRVVRQESDTYDGQAPVEDSSDAGCLRPGEGPTGLLAIDDNPYQFKDDENPLALLTKQQEKIAEYKRHVSGETLLSEQYRSGELADVEDTVTCTEAMLKGIGVFLRSLIQVSEILTKDMGDVSQTLVRRLEKEFVEFVPGGKSTLDDLDNKVLWVHYSFVIWASRRLKSPATRMFV